MDSYCTNLRKQVMRQLDADFDDFEWLEKKQKKPNKIKKKIKRAKS
jgi:hypothetical protein